MIGKLLVAGFVYAWLMLCVLLLVAFFVGATVAVVNAIS